MRRQKLSSAAAAFCLLGVLTLSGCGCFPEKTETQKAAGPVYAVADQETLFKAHARYSDYFRLQQEYDMLLAKYRAEQEQIVRLAAEKEPEAAEAAKKAAEEEFRVRMQIKETSLNQQLENLYREISLRHGGKEEEVSLSTAGETEIANLQLKLKVLGVSGQEKEKAQEELATLLDGTKTVFHTEGWSADEKAEMAAKKEAAEKELSAYAEEVSREIRERQAAEGLSFEKFGLPSPEDWNLKWSDSLKAKQREIDDIREDMLADIRDAAAIVAKKKKIDVIFVRYESAVKAEDVTADIANQIVLNQ
jgi:hypothetical protein